VRDLFRLTSYTTSSTTVPPQDFTVGWALEHASKLEVPASKLEAPASKLEVPASKLEVPVSRLEVLVSRLEVPAKRSVL
jgi:hypothetical protein